jgi:hypothetical protein
MGDYDQPEGEYAEREGMAHLQRQFARLDALSAQGLKVDRVNDGSMLDRDDAATPYSPLTHLVGYMIGVAEDHLETVKTFVTVTEGGVPLMALYTLIRSAVESSSYGLWLLAPQDRNERVLRTLRMTWSNRKDVESLAIRRGTSDSDQLEHVRLRLTQIKDEIPELRNTPLNKIPTMTDIIDEADMHPRLIEGAYPGIVVWKACSGIAHGNQAAGINMLERRQMDPGDGTGAHYWMTTSVAVLALMFEVGVNYLESLSTELKTHNSRSDGGLILG